VKTHKFYLAPLRGITDRVFRDTYEKHFGRFDYMLAPFVSTIRGNRVRDYHIEDLLPANNESCRKRLIPQIIGNDSEGFLLLSRKFADLGFECVNWNLGCPAPLITRKKRGSGLLPHKDIIEQFLEDVIPKLTIPLSIKTRLGLDNKDDLGVLMPIFNNYPLKEIIIHPRTGSQLYGGTVDIDKFETFLHKSVHTVVYNGDIRTAIDFKYLTDRFPNVDRWMIGRGIIMNPYLLDELKGEAITSGDKNICGIRNFLDDLLQACQSDPPHPGRILGRMKGIWEYLAPNLDETGELGKKIMRCETLAAYQEIIDGTLNICG